MITLSNLSRFKKNLIWAGIILALLFLVAGYFVIAGDKTNIKYVENHIPFDDGWTVTVGDDVQDSPSLPVGVKTKTNQSVVFSRVLPEQIPDGYAIISRNYHQILRAYVDDNLIFSYPNEEWSGIGNIISDEWNLIPLNQEYAGHELTISLTNSTVFAFTAYVGEFHYGERNSLVQMIRGRGLYGVVVGIIICVIGSLALIISYLYRAHTNQSINTAMGMALLCFGIWITNRSKMCLFPDHSLFVYWGSLMALMLVAPFVFLYSYFRNEEFRRFALWSFRFCLLMDLFMVISCLFIKYDVEIISMFAYGLTCIALALNAYSLYLGGFGRTSKNKSRVDVMLNKAEFISNLIFPIAAAYEFIFHHDLLWTDSSNAFKTMILVFAITYMIFVLWRTFLVVQDRTIVTQQLHDSQLELMMGQIQPHFIFNTLSSIRTLVMVDPKISYDMLYDFSNYLRANIDNVTNLNGIKFAAEVEHIKSYVNIEKVRFGERLEVEYDIQSDNFIVPPLSIQPLVENAIKHGVCKKVYGGTVHLKSYETPDSNIVEVRDDGVGFDAVAASKVFYMHDDSESIATLSLLDANGTTIVLSRPEDVEDLSGNGSEKHHSAGMMNILLRLKEMSNASVDIQSKEGEGTTIKVVFPKE